MPLYFLSGTETLQPLKEEGEKYSTKPEVLVGTLPTLYKLSLHAYKHVLVVEPDYLPDS